MKKLIAITLLGLLLIPLTASAGSGSAGLSIEIVDRDGDGYWCKDAWYVDLYPGETAETTLRLRNNTSKSIKVELEVDPDEHYDEVKFYWDDGDDEFTISGKHTIDATLYVEVSGSAAPGKYTGELTIKWKREKVKSHRP